jgi:hypothetical protein
MLAVGFLVLAGCDASPVESGPASPSDRAANTFEGKLEGCAATAEAFGGKWVGKPYNELEPLLSNGDIPSVGTVRVIRPGTMVTRDYRTDRLNIMLDDKDIVTKVYCG